MAFEALAPMTCQELVELVTDYLEDALSDRDHARFDEHIALCPMCQVHLEQLRTTIRAMGRIGERDLDPGVLAELQERFRDWNA
ncbi:MAG: zf-HC2 domain-containing protein [Actinobacteria bacterium]|nr:MAG: zf-HC2 domain-containing protein [Actinomycetota bacterium]